MDISSLKPSKSIPQIPGEFCLKADLSTTILLQEDIARA